MCTRAIARNKPPLKAFARLINVGFYPQLLTLAGKIPNIRAIANTTKMKTIFMIKSVFESSSEVDVVLLKVFIS